MTTQHVAQCVTWKCHACGFITVDPIMEDGPFLDLICNDCGSLADRGQLTDEEIAAWDVAIESLDLQP